MFGYYLIHKHPHIFAYRKDPVPYTRKWKPSYGAGCGYRKPKVYRIHKYELSYGRIFCRGKRSSIPDAWDLDYPTAKSYDRSWKRTKKLKQWM